MKNVICVKKCRCVCIYMYIYSIKYNRSICRKHKMLYTINVLCFVVVLSLFTMHDNNITKNMYTILTCWFNMYI